MKGLKTGRKMEKFLVLLPTLLTSEIIEILPLSFRRMKYRHPGAINEHLVFNPNFPPSSSSIYKTSLQLKT
jgi:hypothetical protein